MVENPRETPGPGALRPLNIPVAVTVEEDERQRPLALTLRGRRVEVTSIDDLWEIDEEWWRETPIIRMYYQVTTEDGRSITLFQDRVSGAWSLQRD